MHGGRDIQQPIGRCPSEKPAAARPQRLPVTLMIASVLRREKRCTERVQALSDILKRFARL